MNRTLLQISGLFVVMTMLGGCTFVFQKGRRTDTQTIQQLQDEMGRLNNDYGKRVNDYENKLGDYENKIGQLKNDLSDLDRAKKELEDRLRNEIANDQVKVEMNDRGLVITFLAEVLFDSGKAELRADAGAKLDKVASILKDVSKMQIGVEGHTDNVPIARSKWKDNWELSAHRALAVLNHLINGQGLDPKLLSATGYGEFHPVASNDTKAGRQKNRRVEIVIVPPTTKQTADLNKVVPVQKTAPVEDLK